MNQFAPWTDERIALLKKLWPTGKSASEIALILGVTSRSAVLGKAMRLGLPLRASTGAGRTQQGKAIARAQKRKSAAKPWKPNMRPLAKLLASDGFVPPPDTPIPLEQRKTIQTLEDGDCRWPIGHVGEPDFHFCGAEKVPGLPYCRPHSLRAYAPPDPRRSVKVREISSMPKVKESENV